MKKIIWCILFVSTGFVAKAGGNIMFEQANALYHSKNYDSAAKLYTQLVQSGYCSDDLYYNMGNAFYKAQKLGWAIWSYRKSMKIDCDQNTMDNYRLAKKQIKEPLLEQKEIFFIRWWRALYQLFSVNLWAVIALSSFIFFLLIFYLQTIKKKRIATAIRYTFMSCFLTALGLMFVQYYNNRNHYEAVLVDTARFTSQTNDGVEKVPEGSEVRVVNKHPNGKKDMVLVQLSDLRQGLVDKKAIKGL